MTPRAAKLILLIAIVSSSVGCDQATKLLATHHLRDAGHISMLGDTVRLQYAENPGGFLNLGSRLRRGVRRLVFVVLVPAVLLMLGVHAVRGRASGLLDIVGVAFVIGGGAGNVIDRVAFGFVRDFANLGIGAVRTGIFNVADVAITTGVLVLAVKALWGKGRGGPPADGRWSWS